MTPDASNPTSTLTSTLTSTSTSRSTPNAGPAPSRADCEALDRIGLAGLPASGAFAPGAPGTIHLDANSIGPMPASAPARLTALLEAGWRIRRRRGWNDGDWLEQPRRLGAALAHLIGAAPNEVLVCDSTSINQYKLLRQALAIAAPRRVLVVESAVFPSNRYVAEGIAHAGLAAVRTIASAADLPAALASGDVAAVALSHVDYRNSARLDMPALTRLCHRHGAMVLWDLSHAAGAVAIDLGAADADFAVASGYKYLCGGPGAPALLYVNRRWHSAAWPAICGWMGHADTFGFAPDYRPADGVARHQIGTPSVIANAVFSAATDIWQQVDPVRLDARHRSLTDTLIRLLDQRCAALGLELGSPREHPQRGGHVAVRLNPAAAGGTDVGALGQALVEHGVVVSTRKPDALRFGVHPLTTLHTELWDAVQRLEDLLATGRWRDPGYALRAGV